MFKEKLKTNNKLKTVLSDAKLFWEQKGQNGGYYNKNVDLDRTLDINNVVKQIENIKQELSEQTFATQLEAVEKLRSHLEELLKGKPKPE